MCPEWADIETTDILSEILIANAADGIRVIDARDLNLSIEPHPRSGYVLISFVVKTGCGPFTDNPNG